MRKTTEKTKEDIVRAVADRLGIDSDKLREAWANGVKEADGETVSVDDRLSLMYWDLTQNGGRLGDYDFHNNYFAGLLQQAGDLIQMYRGSAKTKQKRESE